MRVLALGLVLALSTDVSAAHQQTEPARPATIEITPYANCAIGKVVTEDGPVDLGWQACHGWTATQCGAVTVLVSKGVVADRAHVLIDGQLIDIRGKIDARLALSGDETLHLDFGQVECSQEYACLTYEGSKIERGAEGPARDLTGDIVVGPDGISLRLE